MCACHVSDTWMARVQDCCRFSCMIKRQWELWRADVLDALETGPALDSRSFDVPACFQDATSLVSCLPKIWLLELLLNVCRDEIDSNHIGFPTGVASKVCMAESMQRLALQLIVTARTLCSSPIGLFLWPFLEEEVGICKVQDKNPNIFFAQSRNRLRPNEIRSNSLNSRRH